MAKDKSLTGQAGDKSSAQEVDTFLRQVAATTPPNPAADRRGRLLFALDATASREPTWERACRIQAAMFEQASALGGLDVQLCYYRGYREFKALPWSSNAHTLQDHMTAVRCLGGLTQIEKVLRHAIRENRNHKINALVFVGDCMEEDLDQLAHLAGQLSMHGTRAFMFHEGMDRAGERAFKEIARLTGGACCRFDAASAQQLRELLGAVAVYAAGGRRALADYSKGKGQTVLQLTHQIANR